MDFVIGVPATLPQIRGLVSHYSMTRDLLKNLRKRIEATESARNFEYAVRLATTTAKFMQDMSFLDERLAEAGAPSKAAMDASLKHTARLLKASADQLSKTGSDTAKYLGTATADDVLRKQNVEQLQKWRDETLFHGCSLVETQKNIISRVEDASRAQLSPDVAEALDAVEADIATLNADCSSELALDLLKKRAGKTNGNLPKTTSADGPL